MWNAAKSAKTAKATSKWPFVMENKPAKLPSAHTKPTRCSNDSCAAKRSSSYKSEALAVAMSKPKPSSRL